MQPEPLTNPPTVSAGRRGDRPIGSAAAGRSDDGAVPVEMIEAWTDQHPANVARLMTDGLYYGNAARGPSVFRPAIRWMRRQMCERVPSAVEHSPVWLTVTPSIERRRLCDWSCLPNRGPCSKIHLTPGKTWLRVSIPASRVLLSDFDLWDRFVLRYKYLPVDDDDELRWEHHARKATTIGLRESAFQLNPAWPPDLITQLVKSWDRIFDIKPNFPTQATVDLLRPSDIIDTMPSPHPNDVPVRLWSMPNSTYIRNRTVRMSALGESPRRPPNGIL